MRPYLVYSANTRTVDLRYPYLTRQQAQFFIGMTIFLSASLTQLSTILLG